MLDSALTTHLALTTEIAVAAADPAAGYRRLRAQPSVVTSEPLDCAMLWRHADVKRAFTDHRTFSSGYGVGCDGVADPPSLLDLDPPEHDARRRSVAHWFNRSAAQRYEPALRARIGAMVDAVDVRLGTDLMPELFERVPAAALCVLLQVPPEVSDELYRAARRTLLDASDADPGDLAKILAGYAGDGLLAELRAHGDEAAFTSWSLLLFLGGQEPLSTLCGAVVHALTSSAGPSDLAEFTDEVNRLVSPTQFMFRTVSRPVTVGGTALVPGTRVLLSIAAANRDGTVFDQPEVFLPGRPNKTLAYGAGPHTCLGQWLTRTVVPLTVAALLRRHPWLRNATLEPRWAFSGNVRCLSALTVRAR